MLTCLHMLYAAEYLTSKAIEMLYSLRPVFDIAIECISFVGNIYLEFKKNLFAHKHALTTFPFFTFALAVCLQSFHPTHAQLSNRNGKFVFSGTFHIMWVKVGQGILLNRSIFLNKSDQLCKNVT